MLIVSNHATASLETELRFVKNNRFHVHSGDARLGILIESNTSSHIELNSVVTQILARLGDIRKL
jgi:hypothetical protein